MLKNYILNVSDFKFSHNILQSAISCFDLPVGVILKIELYK